MNLIKIFSFVSLIILVSKGFTQRVAVEFSVGIDNVIQGKDAGFIRTVAISDNFINGYYLDLGLQVNLTTNLGILLRTKGMLNKIDNSAYFNGIEKDGKRKNHPTFPYEGWGSPDSFNLEGSHLLRSNLSAGIYYNVLEIKKATFSVALLGGLTRFKNQEKTEIWFTDRYHEMGSFTWNNKFLSWHASAEIGFSFPISESINGSVKASYYYSRIKNGYDADEGYKFYYIEKTKFDSYQLGIGLTKWL